MHQTDGSAVTAGPDPLATAGWSLSDALGERFRAWAGVPVERDIRPYARPVAAIGAIDLASAPDHELRARAASARGRAVAGEPLDALLPEVFALAREVAARTIGLRPFDVQLAAGVALHRGRLVQLDTGEGKTLVAVPPALLEALRGRGVHLFTANDYLARRDAEWMGPIYRFFGLEVGVVGQSTDRDDRRRAYASEITYVTAKEAGFDFLRDHTADDPALLVQRAPNFVIVDEADFILIDEARVPLVIAGPAPSPPVDQVAMAAVVAELRPGRDYDTDEHARTVVLTEAGMERAGALLGGVPLHDSANRLALSGVHVALHARVLLRRDRDYIVRDGRVDLVDEWTGRVAENRRWPHGIQPAVEAKEGLEPRPEGRILGSIPVQHFVGLYPKIAGMTATAVPAAAEFESAYGLRTVVFPPNRPCIRTDHPDLVFTHRAAKMAALAAEIERVHATGRPVLVGTASVAESEELAAALRGRALRCRVLNARRDAREARIIAHAGAPGAVTISTNMAGRGTDIALGALDAAMRETVVALGGLYVIGTNRHESRRIDDQLRGRAGRQGDPGSSRFFVSLEDDLVERYGVVGLIPPSRRPARSDSPVADPLVAREIARGQRIVEGQNHEIRRTLAEYSRMVEEQRRIAHAWRQDLLAGRGEAGECRQRAHERYLALVEAVGPEAVARAERRLAIARLDQAWADHLALIEDIREGIHLQRYGGKEPVTEFHRQIVEAFGGMMARVGEETVEAFGRLTVTGGAIDFSRAGLAGSSTTWTYLINDNPFSTLGLSLLANRGLAMSAGMLAVMYLPVSLAAALSLLARRWLRRLRGRRDGASPGEP